MDEHADRNPPPEKALKRRTGRRSAPAMLLLVVAGAIAIAGVPRCTSSSHEVNGEPVRAVPFDTLFGKVRDFVLEEPFTDPISGIWHLRPLAGDRFLVVDTYQDEVRIHADDGSLIRIVGRRGEGPGEFKNPLEGYVDSEGYLYVTEATPRVSRFTPDLAFDTVIRVPATSVYHIERFGSAMVLGTVQAGVREKYFLMSRDGTILARFHKNPLFWEVPYWRSWCLEDFAVSGDRIFVADGFLYPLHMYDSAGNLVRTFATPPRSWVEPSRPEAGAFIGVSGRRRADEWLRSFTMIRQIDVYRDSLLVVTHSRYTPDAVDFFRTKDIGVDLYDLDGNKLYEDVAVPGKLLRAQDYLYVLLAEPPEGWIVGVYELRGDRSAVE